MFLSLPLQTEALARFCHIHGSLVFLRCCLPSKRRARKPSRPTKKPKFAQSESHCSLGRLFWHGYLASEVGKSRSICIHPTSPPPSAQRCVRANGRACVCRRCRAVRAAIHRSRAPLTPPIPVTSTELRYDGTRTRAQAVKSGHSGPYEPCKAKGSRSRGTW